MIHPSGIARLRPLHYVMLLVIGLALFLPGFSSIPPFDRDESRYAQATHQMLETRDFVDIRYQDEARHKKPVGIYWLQSASVTLLSGFGTDGPIWMYRLPSLLGALAAVLLTAWVGNRLFGPSAGFGAALAMASCIILGVEARMAKTDAVLLATIVAAQGALARIYLDRLKPIPPQRLLLIVFWLALGVGILVKGPITPMVTLFTILALWAMDREIGWVRQTEPKWGIPLMLAIVLPWGIAIAIATEGAFFSYAIGHEFIGKVQTVQEKHSGPFGYYLATFWLTFWPWSFLALLALPWIWARRQSPAVRFCVAWIVPTWLAFELAPTKLPHYTVTVFPAIACLAAAATLDRLKVGSIKRHPLFWAAAAFFILVTLAFAIALMVAPGQLAGPPSFSAALAALIIMATGIGLVLLELRGKADRVVLGTTGGAFLGLAVIFGWALPGLDSMWISPRIQATVERHRPCPTTILAAAGYTEPSMVFLLGTNTKLGGADTVIAHLQADPSCGLGMVATGEDELAFLTGMAALPLAVTQIDKVQGFNYSRGKPVTLHFYRVTTTPEANSTEPATLPATEPAQAPPPDTASGDKP